MDFKKRIERSVDSLQRLYAGVIALALGQGIGRLMVEDRRSEVLSAWSDIEHRLPEFIAFFVILVPFIHGMNRHLDDCYLEGRQRQGGPAARGALLFDFFTFFIQASLLFATSATLKRPLMPFVFLGVLLVLDVVWAFVCWSIHYRGRPVRETPLAWMFVNIGAIATGLLLGLVIFPAHPCGPWVLMIVALARTALDYWVCWSFYFPSENVVAPAPERTGQPAEVTGDGTGVTT